jgi:hypothetical protein
MKWETFLDIDFLDGPSEYFPPTDGFYREQRRATLGQNDFIRPLLFDIETKSVSDSDEVNMPSLVEPDDIKCILDML